MATKPATKKPPVKAAPKAKRTARQEGTLAMIKHRTAAKVEAPVEKDYPDGSLAKLAAKVEAPAKRVEQTVQFYKNGNPVNPGDNRLSSLAWFFTKGVDGDRRMKSAEFREYLIRKLGRSDITTSSWDLALPNGITLSARVPGDAVPPVLEQSRRYGPRGSGSKAPKRGESGKARADLYAAAQADQRAKKAAWPKPVATPALDRFNAVHAAGDLSNGAACFEACRDLGLPGYSAPLVETPVVEEAPKAKRPAKAAVVPAKATKPAVKAKTANRPAKPASKATTKPTARKRRAA